MNIERKCKTCKHFVGVPNTDNMGLCYGIEPQRHFGNNPNGAHILGGIAKGHRDGVKLVVGKDFFCPLWSAAKWAELQAEGHLHD